MRTTFWAWKALAIACVIAPVANATPIYATTATVITGATDGVGWNGGRVPILSDTCSSSTGCSSNQSGEALFPTPDFQSFYVVASGNAMSSASAGSLSAVVNALTNPADQIAHFSGAQVSASAAVGESAYVINIPGATSSTVSQIAFNFNIGGSGDLISNFFLASSSAFIQFNSDSSGPHVNTCPTCNQFTNIQASSTGISGLMSVTGPSVSLQYNAQIAASVYLDPFAPDNNQPRSGQGSASGGYSISLVDSGGGGPTNPTAAPSPLLLAQASRDAYSNTAAPPGYKFLGSSCSDQCSTTGLRVVAYGSDDGTQLIFAVRGTDTNPGDSIALGQNLRADLSFGTGVPTTQLRTDIAEAANFIRAVTQLLSAQHPNVTLTGLSLGGGYAQILGAASGFRAVGFNAPGAGRIYEQVRTEVAPVIGLGIGAENINYRLYGDQISQIGIFSQVPGGTVITLPNIHPNTVIDEDPRAYMVTSHDKDTLVQAIAANPLLIPSNSAGPNITGELFSNLVDGVLISPVLAYTLAVLANTWYYFDPSPAVSYLYQQSATSPSLVCIDLPVMREVGGWDIRSRSEAEWSAFEFLPAGGSLCFDAPNINAVEFIPLDIGGRPTAPGEAFLFSASFASDGELFATLTPTIIVSEVIEPSALAIFVVGLCGLIVIRRVPLAMGSKALSIMSLFASST